MNKTQTLINRILEVDNFQNVACVCENWEEFCFELEEWGVTSAAKIEFDDAELCKKLHKQRSLQEIDEKFKRLN